MKHQLRGLTNVLQTSIELTAHGSLSN